MSFDNPVNATGAISFPLFKKEGTVAGAMQTQRPPGRTSLLFVSLVDPQREQQPEQARCRDNGPCLIIEGHSSRPLRDRAFDQCVRIPGRLNCRDTDGRAAAARAARLNGLVVDAGQARGFIGHEAVYGSRTMGLCRWTDLIPAAAGCSPGDRIKESRAPISNGALGPVFERRHPGAITKCDRVLPVGGFPSPSPFARRAYGRHRLVSGARL